MSVPMPRASEDPLAGLPRNFQRPCLLLLIGEKPSHGYDLLERLQELGFKQADPGMLYRSLRAMEQEGLVTSDWESSDLGPRRRTYVLTEEGRDWLHAWAGSVREIERILRLFVRRYSAFTNEESRQG